MHASSLPRRAFASGLCCFPFLPGGMARRKIQTYGSVLSPDTAGASRRANRGGSNTGPRFSRSRPDRTPSQARSASSWRDLLLGPGGAPMPPGSLLCVSRPAGAATNVPLHERLIIPLLQTSLTLQPPRPLEGRDQKLTFLDFSLEVSPVMALRRHLGCQGRDSLPGRRSSLGITHSRDQARD